jgi:hypothetical protein
MSYNQQWQIDESNRQARILTISVATGLFVIVTGLMNLHHGGKEHVRDCLTYKYGSFDSGELVIIATEQQLDECMK